VSASASADSVEDEFAHALTTMDSIGFAAYTNVFSLLSLTVAIAAALVAGGMYWRGRHAPVEPASAAPVGKIVYRDAPTVRVLDSQRVDRLRKLARLAPGEFIDVLETRAGLPPRFRVTLKRIVDVEGGAVAHIAVDFGGAAVSCGPLVEEIAFNQFVLPRATRDEARNCVFHYQDSGEALDFMRIKLRTIDAAANWAELDIMQVSGHWPRA
jgi:hypothetical protein